MEHGGRPKADIDWNEVDEYLIAGCSGAEIASFIGVNRFTLYDRCQSDKGIMFNQYSQQMKEKGDSLLRHAQFTKALGRNKDADNTMLIWLGKQRLNQKEPETSIKYTEEQLTGHKTLNQKLEELRQDRANADSQIISEQKS